MRFALWCGLPSIDSFWLTPHPLLGDIAQGPKTPQPFLVVLVSSILFDALARGMTLVHSAFVSWVPFFPVIVQFLKWKALASLGDAECQGLSVDWG
jgi:hypothetical protein